MQMKRGGANIRVVLGGTKLELFETTLERKKTKTLKISLTKKK
jgi:hypothetical protein